MIVFSFSIGKASNRNRATTVFSFSSGQASNHANSEEVADLTIIEGGVDSQEGDTIKKRKRKLKLRSKAWNQFTRNLANTSECKCNYCGKNFTCASKGGTTHLNQHIDDGNCPIYKKDLTKKEAKGQTTLGFQAALNQNKT